MNASLLSTLATRLRQSLRTRTSPQRVPLAAIEAPLRAELFSVEQMERHGKALAGAHSVERVRSRDQLLARLAENERVLVGAVGMLTESVRSSQRITPAGEWLLDNAYLIDEQIRTARRHLPKGYSEQLPRLKTGHSAGLPRVYDIALEAGAQGAGRVDLDSLLRFVAAYQEVSDLTLGELWAIPIMLRLALIENLRRVSARVSTGTLDRNQADAWADQMIEVAEKDPKSLILVISDMARSNPPMVNSFVAELARRLQGHGSALALPLTWIEQRLAESSLTIEQLVQSETQSQAANQVSISNSIGSLRFLGAMDWREFVESMSAVERKLAEDPAGVYPQMDFATRDRYRHVIEKLATQTRHSETEVARCAVHLAHEAKSLHHVVGSGHNDARRSHVGYYLIGAGLPELAARAEARPTAADRLTGLGKRFPLFMYLGGIGVLTTAGAAALLFTTSGAGLHPGSLLALALPVLVAASLPAVALVNWVATLVTQPHPLPRMDFSDGIPPASRTLVVVPAMLGTLQGATDLTEALEVRFLANRDRHLHFGLLTDFRDADEESLDADAPLLQHVSNQIEALNRKYDSTGNNTFFLFHRPRLWNPSERLWMGYERKRGKLGAVNDLLLSGDRTPFSHIVGDTTALADARFVITLDTDTMLARDSARQFAGTMAHPLNRAVLDSTSGRVVSGYGILQPRMAVSLPSTNRSRFAQLWGSETGLDPYTRAVSDVYQDLFGEGSFIGKGIYDVETFEAALKGRFPADRILSHDLLEGCYARAGLLSDVQLYEDFPSSYGADIGRRHRWIRGDWQIASWLLSRVPGPGRTSLRNPLPVLAQWKILDNLRRSLVPLALTGLFITGWVAVPAVLAWTAGVLGLMFLAPLVTSLAELARKPADASAGPHLRTALRSAGRHVTQTLQTLACLPFEAFISLDAILRTSVRITLTHRRRLEWNPSAEAGSARAGAFTSAAVPGSMAELAATGAIMWTAPAVAGAALAWLAVVRPDALGAALPIACLWLASPGIAWWLSRPRFTRPARLLAEEATFLRRLARRTWAFFEQFVTPEDHWLPPDNFQEHPVGVVAHRTSPTNMGLALLANLAAYDFGYIPAGQLLDRTSRALQTMQSLSRHKGHFYNWYDTLTLLPLPPHYVSSVDSGNLAGHLLTLRPGLLALADARVLQPGVFQGLADTLGVLQEWVTPSTPASFSRTLVQMQRDIASALDSQPSSADAALVWLDRLAHAAADLQPPHNDPPPEPLAADTNALAQWTIALQRQCAAAIDDMEHLMPWVRDADALQHAHLPPDVLACLAGNPTLHELADGNCASPDARIDLARTRARERLDTIERCAREAAAFADVSYDFLYSNSQKLLTVGYNVDQLRADTGHYDLLASEARLATFIAIAQSKIPQESWFALGRLLTTAGGEAVLLSWSGSMFEYLMPMLVMPTYENTLLDQTCRTAVKAQIAYGKQRGVPWGISESGYNTVDTHLNYQYRAFGVPGLGLKRGLADDLVIAPYASAMALMVMPQEACRNLQLLAAAGMLGPCGMYEAVDFTPSRLPRGQASVTIRSYMAHHQGMSLLGLAWLLLDQPMQRRFESDPLFKATTLLLQERVPAAAAVQSRLPELSDIRTASINQEMSMRVIRRPDTSSPEVQLLSNGRYAVMVTNAGGGYSRWKDFAVTRWREDSTRDNWGAFCYFRDVASGDFWSSAHQPTRKPADTYEAIFSEGRAEFRRLDHGIECHTEIAVSPEDDIELRRVRLTNRTRVRRTIEITSYAEVVLASPAADALHPAFSNLFVQSTLIPEHKAIVCTRRPRAVGEQVPWMFHLMAVHGAPDGPASFETDRARFMGRTRTAEAPQAMVDAGDLSGSAGAVLDPIVAIRRHIVLDPGQTVTINMVLGVGDSRETVMGLMARYSDRNLAARVFDLVWTHSWVNLRQINATESDAQLFARLAGSVIYANPALRADASVLARNRRGQSGLWSHAVSGDLPIVLLQISDLANIDLVRQMVQAHAYWRVKGLAVDLVIWNEDHAGYRQLLQEQIMGLIAAGTTANLTDRPGGIFVKAADQISSEDRDLFQAVARVIITDRRGTLSAQVARRPIKPAPAPMLARLPTARPARAPGAAAPRELHFFNGLGGFRPDGREYVITTGPGQVTPAPWVNVLANAQFGTVVSESGMAYTWFENAHEFRLSPWSNDPVSDGGGEAIYLRDEETGHCWSPTPLPRGGASTYTARHGFGYSVFEHTEDGIESELTVHIDTHAALKFSCLKVRNLSGRSRRLSATGYVEWVLGDLRAKSAMHVITELDARSGAICARNRYSSEFNDRMAFFDAGGSTRAPGVTWTGDRNEFMGRNGSLRSPAAMARTRLSNRVGAGLDPCAAIQVPFELAPGAQHEVVFRLGSAPAADASEKIAQLNGISATQQSLADVHTYWQRTLGAVQVSTPDPTLNLLCNGWLVYQTLACRMWARSGFYQSGGAFGFRDQLQDAMALVHTEPQLLREHLLRCAARQFEDGDVQHWWHPPAGRGVRTHCSDDFLWLPQALCRYLRHTDDTGVLDEPLTYLTGRPVNPEDDSYYDLPGRSETRESLYQHCVRAIEHGLRLGAHGLPLMGSGDWNDGMNLVGMQGKGESVWLAFFLYDTLTRFRSVAQQHGDTTFAERCHVQAGELGRSIDQHGWDGHWYLRAYFDDGTALGSATNTECQIDSISQSWSVLSGAGSRRKTLAAMDAMDRRLVRRDAGLVQLLDPPFDKSDLNPGYIKGYVPGVRENGGQYTHAAIWAAMAFAAMGDSRRAWDIFGLINPVHHGRTAADVVTYKVEPYVVAADVYAVQPHTGRGGWTWYTGSAGWMYRLVLESLLGLQVDNGELRFEPCLPAEWTGFQMHYRHHGTAYHIDVVQSPGAAGPTQVTLDGIVQASGAVPLVNDGLEHVVEVRFSAARHATGAEPGLRTPPGGRFPVPPARA